LGFAQIFREKPESVKPEPILKKRKTVNNSRGAFPPTIKTAFGYKIIQVCGYLNFRYLTRLNQPLT
jgi:hypothetical protein